MATLAVLVACVAGSARIAARSDRNRSSEAAIAATQHDGNQPSAAAIADSQAVAATHRSRTLAALFEEFRTTTPQSARINSRAISNLFFDGNPLMRLSNREWATGPGGWATGTENGRYVHFHSALIRRIVSRVPVRSRCKS